MRSFLSMQFAAAVGSAVEEISQNSTIDRFNIDTVDVTVSDLTGSKFQSQRRGFGP